MCYPGSNIFDICFALGFPLFLYGLVNGPVRMTVAADEECEIDAQPGTAGACTGREDASEIQSIRVLLICMSVIIMAIFLVTKCEKDEKGRTVHLITKVRAVLLGVVYVAWTTAIILHATHGILGGRDVDGSL